MMENKTVLIQTLSFIIVYSILILIFGIFAIGYTLNTQINPPENKTEQVIEYNEK